MAVCEATTTGLLAVTELFAEELFGAAAFAMLFPELLFAEVDRAEEELFFAPERLEALPETDFFAASVLDAVDE